MCFKNSSGPIIWRSLVIRHLKRRLNEQSHPELRHKIQCEQSFSTGGSGTQIRTGWLFWTACLKSRKVLTDKVNLNAADPDTAATEKQPLRILIIIIIVVIIIILWYNKDIWPLPERQGVQWFAVAMVQWSPLGFAVGSVSQPTICQESAGVGGA